MSVRMKAVYLFTYNEFFKKCLNNNIKFSSICYGGTSTFFHITVPAVFEGKGVPAHFLQTLVP